MEAFFSAVLDTVDAVRDPAVVLPYRALTFCATRRESASRLVEGVFQAVSSG
jgi:hypothetical protein